MLGFAVVKIGIIFNWRNLTVCFLRLYSETAKFKIILT